MTIDRSFDMNIVTWRNIHVDFYKCWFKWISHSFWFQSNFGWVKNGFKWIWPLKMTKFIRYSSWWCVKIEINSEPGTCCDRLRNKIFSQSEKRETISFESPIKTQADKQKCSFNRNESIVCHLLVDVGF